MNKKELLLEYSKGQKLFGSGYLSRIGSPGNYIYIYPSKKTQKIGRKYRVAYTRFVKKSRRTLNRLSTRYEATSMNVKPKSWHSALVNITARNGGTLSMKMNLKSHSVKSYRSVNMGTGGVSSQLAKSKRKGVLRYR